MKKFLLLLIPFIVFGQTTKKITFSDWVKTGAVYGYPDSTKMPAGPMRDSIRAAFTTMDSLHAIVPDTTKLKTTSGNTAYLKTVVAGKEIGGGMFVKIDSTYPEGIVAFNHPTVGKQWVRLRFLEDKSTVHGSWLGWNGDSSSLDARLAEASLHASKLKARLLLGAGVYILRKMVVPTPPFTLSGERGDSNLTKIVLRAINDTITRTGLILAGGGVVITKTEGLVAGMAMSAPSGSSVWAVNPLGGPPVIRIANATSGGSEWSGIANFAGTYSRQVYWVRNYLLLNDTTDLRVGMAVTGLGGSTSSTIVSIPDTGHIVRIGPHTLTDSTAMITYTGGSSVGLLANISGYYRLENLTFEGENQNGYNNAYPFNQNIGNSNRVYVDHCDFRNTWEGLRFQRDSNEVYITNCRFFQDTTEYRSTTSGKLSIDAISFQGNYGNLFVKNIFVKFDCIARRGPVAGVGTAGIYSPATNNVTVEDFEVHHVGEFMQWYPYGAVKAGHKVATFNRGKIYNTLFLLSIGDTLNHVYVNDVKFIRDANLLPYSLRTTDNPPVSALNLRGGTAILSNCLFDSLNGTSFIIGDSTSLLRVTNSTFKHTHNLYNMGSTAVAYNDGRTEIENCSFLDSMYVRVDYPYTKTITFKNNHFYSDFEFVIYYNVGQKQNTTINIVDNLIDGNFSFMSWDHGADTIRSYYIRNPNIKGNRSLPFGGPSTLVSAYIDLTGVSQLESSTNKRKAIYIRNLKPTAKFSITPIGTPAALAYEAKIDSLIVTGSDSTAFYYKWESP
jgi:hypothetical protein